MLTLLSGFAAHERDVIRQRSVARTNRKAEAGVWLGGIVPYLLRGLIKCGLCGLTFSGLRQKAPQRDHYYKCNGRQQARGLYGRCGPKCSAKSLNGDYVETSSGQTSNASYGTPAK
jgi:hypothetical protein